MAVGGIGSFSALTSYSGVNSSKANSELEFDKIYQQKTDSVEINSTAGNNDIMLSNLKHHLFHCFINTIFNHTFTHLLSCSQAGL
jgi:hypothetical protein